MIRILIFLAILAAAAAGFAWIADRPGEVSITWLGNHYETSVSVALLGVLLAAIAFTILWGLLSLVLRLPGLVALSARMRRRNKGFAALSKGMVAAGAGDSRAAQRAADAAEKHLGENPLTLLLRAQAAQLAGDRATTERTFSRMLDTPETRVLGLRGLHVEARRRGDAQSAHHYAEQAHRIAPLSWAGQAVLDHHSASQNWPRALAAVDANLAQRTIDKATARRQRAVLQTAIALDIAERDAPEALRLAREAAGMAPDLVPAVALAGRLLARGGDLRKAARVIEACWKLQPHPDLAQVYLDLRSGDSSNDRLARAKALSRLAPDDSESRLVVARAAIDAREFDLARETMRPLIDGPVRPTTRMCLVMADLEETETGMSGRVREWLARASRAPRDKAWVADGIASDTWAPVSPATGKLDAFRWQTPAEQLSAPWEPMPADAPMSPAAVEAETIIAPAALAASPASPDPAVAATAAQEDALTKLAAIRRSAMAAPESGKADLYPLTVAPDDPGPEPFPKG